MNSATLEADFLFVREGRIHNAPDPAHDPKTGIDVQKRSAHRATRVLLVVNHTLDRGGLRAILESQPDLEVAGEAEDCHEAANYAHHLSVDVVLLRAQGQWADLAPAIHALAEPSGRPSVRILVVESPSGDAIEEANVMQAGASGMLLKDSSPRELVAALRLVAAGYQLLTPSITRELAHGRNGQHGTPPVLPEAFSALTNREQQVFWLIARGCSNAEIAKLLVLGENTIKSHVQHLLAKLGLRNRVHAVIYAYQNCLIPAGSLA